MGNSTEARLNTSENYRLARLPCRTDCVCVRYCGSVRTAVVLTAGGEVVLSAPFADSRIVRDHRIHATRTYPPEKVRFAQGFERVRIRHVGLAQYGHAITGPRKNLSDDRHAGIWRIDISISAHEDDVRMAPPKLAHLISRDRKKPHPLRPVRIRHSAQDAISSASARSFRPTSSIDSPSISWGKTIHAPPTSRT